MFLEPLIAWALLAGGAVLAGFAARKGGHGAVIGVFCAVWAILYSLSVIRALLLSQHDGVGRVLVEVWKTPTILVAATMIPWLWLTDKTSVLKSAAWGVGAATIMMFVVPVIAIVAALAIPEDHNPCRLPSLESPIPSRTTIGIGTRSYFSDSCPVPVARELEFDREYGTIYMQWWDARPDHQLRMSGQTPDGESLGIGVNRVDPTGRSEYSPEPREQRIVTFFPEQFYIVTADTPQPDEAEAFSITVFGVDGEPLEEIPLHYLPRACTCVFYDSF